MVIEIILDQLINNEASSDKEIIDFLEEQTGLSKYRIENLVSELRGYFLSRPEISVGESFELVSKALKKKESHEA